MAKGIETILGPDLEHSLATTPLPAGPDNEKKEVVHELSGSSFAFAKENNFARASESPQSVPRTGNRAGPDLSTISDGHTEQDAKVQRFSPQGEFGSRGVYSPTIFDRFATWLASILKKLEMRLLRTSSDEAKILPSKQNQTKRSDRKTRKRGAFRFFSE